MNDIKQLAEQLGSEQEEERLAALRSLAGQPESATLELLLVALGDPSWRVRKDAADLYMRRSDAVERCGEVIRQLYSPDNAGLRNAAVEILIRLGDSAITALQQEAGSDDHDVRKFVLDILGGIGDPRCIETMIAALDDSDDNVRAAAAENLGKIRAIAALPALLKAMEQADLLSRFTILEAIGRIGHPVDPAVLLEYQDDPLLKKPLFECLGRVGGEKAIPCLVAGLTDERRDVQEAAFLAIQKMADRYPGSVAKVLSESVKAPIAAAAAELLGVPAQAVRRAAIKLLGWLADPHYARQLLELLEDEELQESAAAALVAMGRVGAEALSRLWSEGDSRIKTYIAYIFGQIGYVDALPLLREALGAPDVQLKQVAAQALGRLRLGEALQLLPPLLADPSAAVRDAAQEALSLLGRNYRSEALAELLPLLQHPQPEVRTSVVTILGRLAGPEVQAGLHAAAKDPSPLVRRAAVRAFAATPGEDTVSDMMLCLTDEDAEVRRLAVETLGASTDPAALQPLELALQDEDIWVRAAAIRALGRSGADAAWHLVEAGVGDPVGLVSIAALETLVGLDAERAYPICLAALEHADEEVVNASVQLLAASGRTEWLDQFAQTLLEHPHWEVRISIIRALAGLRGAAALETLEAQLQRESEDLVRQQLQEFITMYADQQG